MISLFKKNKFKVTLIVLWLVFVSLSFRNPFNNRSILPNLEPYNDSLYYSLPTINFLKGKGFVMSAFGREVTNLVPPLYSIYLLPFFAIFQNIRIFYIANMILALGSIYFFCKSCKIIFKNNFIVLFLGGILVTNFYFYNLPSLLMAENPTIFLTIFSFYLLISKKSKRNVILAGILGVIFWLIKSSNLSLGIVFYLLYLIKLLKNGFYLKRNILLKYYFFSAILSGVVYLIYFKFIYVSNVGFNSTAQSSFDLSNFVQNFKFYINSLLGNETRYLWYQELLLVKPFFILAILGLIIGILTRKRRILALVSMVYFLGLVIFMSFYFFSDLRYIQAILPFLILGIGILVEFIWLKVDKMIGLVILFILVIFYLFASSHYADNREKVVISFKKQLALNFKYKQDPWNYYTVENFNEFLQDKEGKNYIASFLSPFFVEVYTNGSFDYLTIGKSNLNSYVMDYWNKSCGNNELVSCYQ